MIPLQKVKDIIDKHNILEKELSSGKVDPKLFAKKSKEYSNLGEIILTARSGRAARMRQCRPPPH